MTQPPLLDALPPLASLIRAGDAIVVGQAGAEPLTVTRALVEQADTLAGPVDVFLGAVLSDTFARALHPNLRPGGYGIMGGAAKGFASQPGSIVNVTPTP